MTSRKNHNWFDKPSVFILSLLIMLFIFVLFITMIIGTNVSSLLEQTTIEGLQSQQKSIADDIDRIFGAGIGRGIAEFGIAQVFGRAVEAHNRGNDVNPFVGPFGTDGLSAENLSLVVI